MNRWSGSRLARYQQCLAAALIPAIEQERDLDSLPAARGTALHLFLRRTSEAGRDVALAEVAEEWREDAAVIDTEETPAALPGSFSAEVALAWNWRADTARVLAEGEKPDDATEIGGQLDSLGLTEDAVVVWDYKTGRKFLGRPVDAAQLRAYALFAARAFGKERAHIGFIRLSEEGEPFFSRDTLEVWDLDATAESIGSLRALADDHATTGEPPQMREGAECKWCPSYRNCPAKRSLVASLATGDAVPMEAPLGVAAVAVAHMRISMVRQACDEAERLVREFVTTHGPVPLGGGKELARVEVGRSSVDHEKARPLLVEKYDENVAAEAITTKTTCTLGALDEAVGNWFRRQNGGKAKGVSIAQKAAREFLALNGALSTAKTYQFKERKLALPATTTTQQEGPDHGEG